MLQLFTVAASGTLIWAAAEGLAREECAGEALAAAQALYGAYDLVVQRLCANPPAAADAEQALADLLANAADQVPSLLAQSSYDLQSEDGLSAASADLASKCATPAGSGDTLPVLCNLQVKPLKGGVLCGTPFNHSTSPPFR